jgi:hypothetical protein
MDYYPGKYLSRRLKNGAVIRSCPALHVVGADFGEMQNYPITFESAVIGNVVSNPSFASKRVCGKARHIYYVMLRSAATKHLGRGYSPRRQILRFAQNDIPHTL